MYGKRKRISGEGIQQQLWEMRERADGTDVAFLVGPEKTRVFAHKLVLHSASEDFRTILSGPEAEKGDIKLEDANTEDFLRFLKFVYFDEIDIKNCREAIELCYMSHKFQVSKLSEYCIDFLDVKINVANLWSIMKLADFVNSTQLKEKCIQVLQSRTLEILNYSSFVDIKKSQLIVLLKQQDLNVNRNEVVLIDAVLKWANANNVDDLPIRTFIGSEILKLLRFLSVSIEQFADKYANCKLLTKREVIAIFAIKTGSKHTLPSNISEKQNSRSFSYSNTNKRFIFNVYSGISTNNTIINTKNTLCVFAFSSNISFWLAGIGFNGQQSNPMDGGYPDYKEHIKFSVSKVDDGLSETLEETNYFGICFFDSCSVAMLDDPVYIFSNTCYEIKATLYKPGTYTQRCIEYPVRKSNAGIILKYYDDYEGMSVNPGFFESFIICEKFRKEQIYDPEIYSFTYHKDEYMD